LTPSIGILSRRLKILLGLHASRLRMGMWADYRPIRIILHQDQGYKKGWNLTVLQEITIA
jgi:hypothetical protein